MVGQVNEFSSIGRPIQFHTNATQCFNMTPKIRFLLVIAEIVLSVAAANADEQVPATHVASTPAFIEDLVHVYSPVSPEIKNELCKKHSVIFQEAALRNELWALKMVDASSKFPSGLLSGSGVDLGNYDQCLSVEVADPEAGTFTGQHCMVSLGKLTFTNEINFMKKYTTQVFEEMPAGNNVTLENWRSQLSVLWSVCVPSTCSPRDVETHLRASLRPWLGDVDVTILDEGCNSNAIKPVLSAADWCIIRVFIVTLTMVVASTLYDIISSNSKSRNELCIGFSLKLHVHRLLKITSPNINDLPVLWGVRVLSMLWIMTIHYWMVTYNWPGVNYTLVNQELGDWIIWRFFANIMAVDNFFLMSGLLVCFNFFKDRQKGIKFNIFSFCLHRFLRLTPTLALTILFATMSTIPGLMGGPLWRSNCKSFKEPCSNSWYYNLLYINNYQSVHNMCIGYTWYLSVDMQLYILSPLILYPLWKWPVFGKFLLGVFFIMGNIISSLVAHYSSHPKYLIAPFEELSHSLYFPTYTRFTPWVIGIAVGYLLYHTRSTQPKISTRLVKLGWTLSIMLMLSSVPFIIKETGLTSFPLLKTFYLGLFRSAWSLGVAWLIFALSRNYGPSSITNFLSLPVFQVLAKICYSVYLTHFLLLFNPLRNMQESRNIYQSFLIYDWFANIIICTMFGAMWCLLYESPFIYIERVLTQGGKNRK